MTSVGFSEEISEWSPAWSLASFKSRSLLVGGNWVCLHSRNLASLARDDHSLAIEEQKDLLGLGGVQRTLWGWQCMAGHLGRWRHTQYA
jgi:hypothetical protein